VYRDSKGALLEWTNIILMIEHLDATNVVPRNSGDQYHEMIEALRAQNVCPQCGEFHR
jgi:hypothetical protein